MASLRCFMTALLMASNLARRHEADWPSVFSSHFQRACSSMGTGGTWWRVVGQEVRGLEGGGLTGWMVGLGSKRPINDANDAHAATPSG